MHPFKRGFDFIWSLLILIKISQWAQNKKYDPLWSIKMLSTKLCPFSLYQLISQSHAQLSENLKNHCSMFPICLFSTHIQIFLPIAYNRVVPPQVKLSNQKLLMWTNSVELAMLLQNYQEHSASDKHIQPPKRWGGSGASDVSIKSLEVYKQEHRLPMPLSTFPISSRSLFNKAPKAPSGATSYCLQDQYGKNGPHW